jgi:hypothetical protein
MVIANTAGLEVIVVAILTLLILAGLTPIIFYIVTLKRTFNSISVKNQGLEPWLVWLLLIPFFNIVWHFIVVTRLSESLEAEYRMRDHPTMPRPSYDTGIAMCVLTCLSCWDLLTWPAGISAIIIWIIYWTEIHKHKKTLRRLPPFIGDTPFSK